MTWSYNPTLLGTTHASADRTAIRFLIQDTSTGDQLVQNEEIDWALSQAPNVYEAAAMVCETIGVQYAKKATQKSAGQLSLSWQGRGEHYKGLAKSFRALAKSPTVRAFTPYAGGISLADKQLQDDDTDWNKPSFGIGMHDHKGTPAETEWIST